MSQNQTKTRKLTVAAMLSAVAALLMFLDFSLPIIPSFVKMDVSELPALLASFSLGPSYGILVCLIKNVFNLLFHGGTGGIGELCNFLLAAALGAVAMAVVSVPVNYYISYPVYAKMFGGLDQIIAAYQVLRPGTDGLMEALLVFNMPFTLLKGAINAALTFLIYKPLSPVLHGRR